ncbi:hypothetical protein [Streptomyces pseudovenezuelae]|uniref:Uncharacterized protein n=1 Tax=Streptomyces pseudovenezuelae TaxID=67350 RepID=A0ABT6M208_9ACTN|nr:hypothetical protein [Streptomyces pseudovenezuelae]MDH6222592.1 hypothetical protein [Streptomyces pseudovenezuelae]
MGTNFLVAPSTGARTPSQATPAPRDSRSPPVSNPWNGSTNRSDIAELSVTRTKTRGMKSALAP